MYYNVPYNTGRDKGNTSAHEIKQELVKKAPDGYNKRMRTRRGVSEDRFIDSNAFRGKDMRTQVDQQFLKQNTTIGQPGTTEQKFSTKQ